MKFWAFYFSTSGSFMEFYIMWILISKYPWESWKREEHELCGLVNSLHPRDKTLQLHLYYILNYLLQWTLLGYI